MRFLALDPILGFGRFRVLNVYALMCGSRPMSLKVTRSQKNQVLTLSAAMGHCIPWHRTVYIFSLCGNEWKRPILKKMWV